MTDPVDRTRQRSELGRITLSVLFIGGLIVGSLWVLAPFLGAFVWATMIVVATWPMLRRLEPAFGGRRAPAVTVMSLGLLAILIVPLGVALFERLPSTHLPAAPEWLGRVPLVGEQVLATWNRLAGEGMAALALQAQPYLRAAATWLAQQAGGFAMVLLQFVLVVILSAVLYAGGESWAAWIRRFGRKLADEQGDRRRSLHRSADGDHVRPVHRTARSDPGAAGGHGLGPSTAWVPAGGVFLLVWSLVVGLMDNVLRPLLIKRGADLPLLLIFAGVIGGLVAFGIVGIFVGPVVLAVPYTLLDSWVGTDPAMKATQ